MFNLYKESKNRINSAYKVETEKEKKKIKASAEYKEAVKVQKELLREFGFSEFQFCAAAIKHSEHFRGIIPTMLAQRSIGGSYVESFQSCMLAD